MLSQFKKNTAQWAAVFASTHPSYSFSAHFFGALKEEKRKSIEGRSSKRQEDDGNGEGGDEVEIGGSSEYDERFDQYEDECVDDDYDVEYDEEYFDKIGKDDEKWEEREEMGEKNHDDHRDDNAEAKT